MTENGTDFARAISHLPTSGTEGVPPVLPVLRTRESFSGVGGSGRRPFESADPDGRGVGVLVRAAEKGGL